MSKEWRKLQEQDPCEVASASSCKSMWLPEVAAVERWCDCLANCPVVLWRGQGEQGGHILIEECLCRISHPHELILV